MDKDYREQLLAAVGNRHSVRRYLPESIDQATRRLIDNKIEDLNREGGLHMQAVYDEPKGFSGFFAYGQFSGVRNYIVVAGSESAPFDRQADLQSLDERVGYFGEQFVLYAQSIGLNTCWAGLSYRKVKGTYELSSGEKIRCYIALGYGETQGVDHKIKTPADVSNAGADTPGWFLSGVEAALLAPTAVNQQKFSFEYRSPASEGGLPTVIAKPGFSLVGYTKMDLGIAKLHFELGAGGNRFKFVSR